jgi:hypothetical protein
MEQLIKALKEGVCIVSYKKIDTDEIRNMECTLKPELIPTHIDIRQSPDSHHILVWALDRDAWRSFRVSTMQEWNVK